MKDFGIKRQLFKRFDGNLIAILVLAIVMTTAYGAGLNAIASFSLFLGGSAFLLLTSIPSQVSDKVNVASSPVDDNEADVDHLTGVQAGLGILDTPIIVLDGRAIVLFQNAAAEQTFGSLPVGEHMSGKLRSPALLDLVSNVVETGISQQMEFSEKLPMERDYVVRVAPSVTGDDKKHTFYILSFREITDLRRIDRMRSDFVANASHELRTPLASLRGFIETLLGPAKDDATARERFLTIMLEQANRMSRLVDDLLSLSRLELRANIAPNQKVDLKAVLQHVNDTLLPLANQLDVELNLHMPEKPVMVVGDRDELVQVFQNLVENACKYGQEGKEVDVWLRYGSDGPIEVSVIDKGHGIPAEHIPRLTERFYRASITDSRSKKGTGLGLAIVKHILTRHKARLIIRSQMGEGTDFTVRF